MIKEGDAAESNCRLTRRDHFAMAALSALITRAYETVPDKVLAIAAYAVADAMEKERNQ